MTRRIELLVLASQDPAVDRSVCLATAIAPKLQPGPLDCQAKSGPRNHCRCWLPSRTREGSSRCSSCAPVAVNLVVVVAGWPAWSSPVSRRSSHSWRSSPSPNGTKASRPSTRSSRSDAMGGHCGSSQVTIPDRQRGNPGAAARRQPGGGEDVRPQRVDTDCRPRLSAGVAVDRKRGVPAGCRCLVSLRKPRQTQTYSLCLPPMTPARRPALFPSCRMCRIMLTAENAATVAAFAGLGGLGVPTCTAATSRGPPRAGRSF